MVLQVLTILGFVTIAYQDIKERMVNWVLFPISAFLLGAMYLKKSYFINFIINISINLFIVFSIISLLWMYTKILRRKRFLNASLGIGDILFLCGFALGFPTVTFIVLLASCLCFSVLAFVVLNYFVNTKTVPLAGFMSLFLTIILLFSNLPNFVSLYHI